MSDLEREIEVAQVLLRACRRLNCLYVVKTATGTYATQKQVNGTDTMEAIVYGTDDVDFVGKK